MLALHAGPGAGAALLTKDQFRANVSLSPCTGWNQGDNIMHIDGSHPWCPFHRPCDAGCHFVLDLREKRK